MCYVKEIGGGGEVQCCSRGKEEDIGEEGEYCEGVDRKTAGDRRGEGGRPVSTSASSIKGETPYTVPRHCIARKCTHVPGRDRKSTISAAG